MTQISLTSPAAVTIMLERSKILSVAPGISSYVTVAIPAESVAATVSAATDFGPYLADREVTLNLSIGTVVYEVKDSAGGGSVSAASIVTALDAATPTELAEIQSSVSGGGEANVVNFKTSGDIGIGNKTSDTAAFTAAIAYAAPRGWDVVIPPGLSLLINNDSASYTVTGFNQKLKGGGEIKFSSLANNGIRFVSSASGGVENLSLSYASNRTSRNSAQLLSYIGSSGFTLSDLRLSNGNSSAVLIDECTNFSASKINMKGFLANGLFITNCADFETDLICGDNIGDAVLELSTYAGRTGVPLCTRASTGMLRASNCVNGLILNSCTEVMVGDIFCTNTSGPPVIITQDLNTTTAHWPDKITLSTSNIIGAGSLGNVANVDAVQVSVSTPTANPIRIDLGRLTITGATRHGLHIADTAASAVVCCNAVNVSGTAGIGVRVGGAKFAADTVDVKDAGSFGFYGSACRDLSVTMLSVSNTQTTGADTRAVLFNACPKVLVSHIDVKDAKPVPTGYVVGDAGSSAGTVTRVTSSIPSGALAISNLSPALAYFITDAGGTVPVTKKFTISYTAPEFRNSWSPQEPLALSLPARAKVIGITVKHSTVFSDGAGAMTDVLLSLGTDAQRTFFTAQYSVGEANPVSNSAYQDTAMFKSLSQSASSVYAIFSAVGRSGFGDNATTYLVSGDVSIWVCYIVAPA